MCLIVFALDVHPSYPLVLVANRDEFHRRPTAGAAFWNDAPHVLAGRDLEADGTWLGVTTQGRFAALTNYREQGNQLEGAPSRGTIVADFLTGEDEPGKFVAGLADGGDRFNPFNVVLGDGREYWYYGNRGGSPEKLGAGIYGLSNHLLDTGWPKVKRSAKRLRSLLKEAADLTADDLVAIVDDRNEADDHDLPATGIPVEWERLLSAPCIVSAEYGTRSTTSLLVDSGGRVAFSEYTRDRTGDIVESRVFTFEIS